MKINFSSKIFFLCEMKIFIFGQLCLLKPCLKCHCNILEKKYPFIFFLSMLCAKILFVTWALTSMTSYVKDLLTRGLQHAARKRVQCCPLENIESFCLFSKNIDFQHRIQNFFWMMSATHFELETPALKCDLLLIHKVWGRLVFHYISINLGAIQIIRDTFFGTPFCIWHRPL